MLYLYILTDGFDLGVGILCLTTSDETVRGVMTETIEGVWHANQTWLVILGGSLFGAYPLVYGTVLAALYLPAGCSFSPSWPGAWGSNAGARPTIPGRGA